LAEQTPHDERWQRLAALAVAGANVQPDQIVMVSGELDNALLADAVAAAAYDRGARFVDVVYTDPRLKRVRAERADPETLSFVPPWYGQRLLQLAEQRGARITFSGPTAPGVLDGLDPELTGRDRLPWLKEVTQVIGERATNWCIVPCPHPAWAQLVHPDLPADEAYERLWQELEHILRLDEPDPVAAWDERMTELTESATKLSDRRFDAIHLRGPGTDLTLGLLPTGTWLSASFETADGLKHYPNLPTEEVFTSPDPRRVDGHVAATKPLVLRDGTIIRGLRVRFEHGEAVEIDADENAGALRATVAVPGGTRLGELALVDRRGRIGPTGTVFYDTLLDENAASHLALGSGFPFLVDDVDVEHVNHSDTHVDFMVGSAEVEVDGLTVDGGRVPLLRGGDWQI
jgi:aminopeptidase